MAQETVIVGLLPAITASGLGELRKKGDVDAVKKLVGQPGSPATEGDVKSAEIAVTVKKLDARGGRSGY